jgi:hypothetical protein
LTRVEQNHYAVKTLVAFSPSFFHCVKVMLDVLSQLSHIRLLHVSLFAKGNSALIFIARSYVRFAIQIGKGEGLVKSGILMEGDAGIEPATFGSGDQRSIH